jgi:hypothetical protein
MPGLFSVLRGCDVTLKYGGPHAGAKKHEKHGNSTEKTDF